MDGFLFLEPRMSIGQVLAEALQENDAILEISLREIEYHPRRLLPPNPFEETDEGRQARRHRVVVRARGRPCRSINRGIGPNQKALRGQSRGSAARCGAALLGRSWETGPRTHQDQNMYITSVGEHLVCIIDTVRSGD